MPDHCSRGVRPSGVKNVVRALSLTAAVLAGATAQAAVADATVADVQLGPAAVSFLPTVADYHAISLRVAGPDGAFWSYEFAAGEAVAFPPAALALADGSYTYELQVTPLVDTATREAMQRHRELRAGGADAREELGFELPQGAVQAGHFRVVDGAIFTDLDRAEAPAAAGRERGGLRTGQGLAPVAEKAAPSEPTEDQQILDDLIVVGSACVGQDCVNGESFGFDTIRLKENNLRIKFQDTSTSASFPSRDWQITANDSGNGGANKFSIDDIDGGRTPFTIEADAPSHSLYVDDGGRIGFGTSTPVVELHVVDGDTPTLRLEQDGSNGFTPQTWDVAGNETNFFIRDATNGSNLAFRIQAGADANSIYVDNNGNVGLGTTSPAETLEIGGDGCINFEGAGSIKASDGQVDVQGNFSVNPASGSADIFMGSGGTDAYRWRYNPSSGEFNWSETGVATFFRVESGMSNNMIVIDGTGVGIGTVNPIQSSAGTERTLDVNGAIYQRGGVLHADYVFEPDYELESIEEHAALMWKNKHLPGIGKRTVDEDGKEIVDIGAQRRGILEELEKAHIYIAELNESLCQLQTVLDQKDERLRELETERHDVADVEDRLAELEAVVNALAAQ